MIREVTPLPEIRPVVLRPVLSIRFAFFSHLLIMFQVWFKLTQIKEPYFFLVTFLGAFKALAWIQGLSLIMACVDE